MSFRSRNTSSILKSLHTGLSDFHKFTTSNKVGLYKPHLCLLAASKGVSIKTSSFVFFSHFRLFCFEEILADIIRYKCKNPNTPDPMVMRIIFDSIKSTPKFNSQYAHQTLSECSIGWELFLMTSSLLSNQTFIFEHESNSSANSIILEYMDNMIAACKTN